MTKDISNNGRKCEERWLLRKVNGELLIERRSISQYVSINRLLDCVDSYDMKTIPIN